MVSKQLLCGPYAEEQARAEQEAQEARAANATVREQEKALTQRAAAVVAAEEGMEVWRRQVLAEAARSCADREAVLRDWESRIEGERDELNRKIERQMAEHRHAEEALEAKSKVVQDAADAAAAAHADARSRSAAAERHEQELSVRKEKADRRDSELATRGGELDALAARCSDESAHAAAARAEAEAAIANAAAERARLEQQARALSEEADRVAHRNRDVERAFAEAEVRWLASLNSFRPTVSLKGARFQIVKRSEFKFGFKHCRVQVRKDSAPLHPSPALLGAGAAHPLLQQQLHAGVGIVPVLFTFAGVHHVDDVVDGDGRLRDVGGDDDLAIRPRRVFEDHLLLRRGQRGV